MKENVRILPCVEPRPFWFRRKHKKKPSLRIKIKPKQRVGNGITPDEAMQLIPPWRRKK